MQIKTKYWYVEYDNKNGGRQQSREKYIIKQKAINEPKFKIV